MAETTAAKSLSALVYSPAQSKALFKTHGKKKNQRQRAAPRLSRNTCVSSTVPCREKLYYELNKHCSRKLILTSVPIMYADVEQAHIRSLAIF